MKKIFIGLMSFMAAFCFASCEYDNYEEPDTQMTGRIVYKGEQLNVRNNEINLRLYELGWELTSSTYLNVGIAQDGTFSAMVYKGKDYELERLFNSGPWLNPAVGERTEIKNYDGKSIDVEVTPYYLLKNVSITCSGKVISGSASIETIDGSLPIESVGLYVSRNLICDNVYSAVGNSVNKSVTGDSVSLQVDLNSKSVNSTAGSLPSTGFVYARLGLKVSGITPMIYSAPIKVEF